MKIKDVIDQLNCKVIHHQPSDHCQDIEHVIASDLMSDVLTDHRVNVILVTSLCSEQAIRTADMIDCCCVIIVKGKKILPAMTELAKELGITLLSTDLFKFEASVILGKILDRDN